MNVLAGSSTSVSASLPVAVGTSCAMAAAAIAAAVMAIAATDPPVSPLIAAASSVPAMSIVKVWLAEAKPSDAVIVKLSAFGAFSALMASLFGT